MSLPDRIWASERQTWIVAYKNDRPRSIRLSGQSQLYLKQSLVRGELARLIKTARKETKRFLASHRLEAYGKLDALRELSARLRSNGGDLRSDEKR